MEEKSDQIPEETAEEVNPADPAEPGESLDPANGAPETEEPQPDFPLPPASFEFLVFSLRSQAEMHMGLMSFTEEKPVVNLPLAQHAIDMLGILLEKTKGNLSLEESRLLENSVTELRFRFVQASEEAKNA